MRVLAFIYIFIELRRIYFLWFLNLFLKCGYLFTVDFWWICNFLIESELLVWWSCFGRKYWCQRWIISSDVSLIITLTICVYSGRLFYLVTASRKRYHLLLPLYNYVVHTYHHWKTLFILFTNFLFKSNGIRNMSNLYILFEFANAI